MRGVSAPAVMHIVGSLEGGGAERWVRELAPQIAKRGVPTEIITIYPPRLDGATIASLGCKVTSRRKRAGFDPTHFAWLVREIRHRAPAIVHTHQWAGKYVGRAAAVLAGTRVIVHTEHSSLPVSRPERVATRLLSLRTDAVVTFSKRNANAIAERERVRRFEIIRNGLPIRAAPSAESRARARACLDVTDEIVFGFVANLKPNKNPDLVVRAFASMVRGGGRDARMELFGDGPMRSELERLVYDLGMSDRVRFRGFVSDVRAMLPGLDVFVTASAREMAPISMLEAMDAALPIIGTPHFGTLDMIVENRNGAIVDWNERELCAAMRYARDNMEWRERCGRAGRAIVERDYDIEVIAADHVALYQRLVRERSRSVMLRRTDRHDVEVGKT